MGSAPGSLACRRRRPRCCCPVRFSLSLAFAGGSRVLFRFVSASFGLPRMRAFLAASLDLVMIAKRAEGGKERHAWRDDELPPLPLPSSRSLPFLSSRGLRSFLFYILFLYSHTSPEAFPSKPYRIFYRLLIFPSSHSLDIYSSSYLSLSLPYPLSIYSTLPSLRSRNVLADS